MSGIFLTLLITIKYFTVYFSYFTHLFSFYLQLFNERQFEMARMCFERAGDLSPCLKQGGCFLGDYLEGSYLPT